MKRPIERQYQERRRQSTRAFTLVEVLISAIILAIGLVGLAAVFPAVISQQQHANDLQAALTLSESADAMLSTRLPAFAARFSDPTVQQQLGTQWWRINAVAYRNGGALYGYLQTPSQPADLRIRQPDVYLVPQGLGNIGLMRRYNIRTPYYPISQDGLQDDLYVEVDLKDTVNGQPVIFYLDPDYTQNPVIFAQRGGGSRMVAGQPNAINFLQGALQFNFQMNTGEVLVAVTVHYKWLNDRIVSQNDRLYPADQPRYAWDMAFRRAPDGAIQYTTFIYRFDGGDNKTPFFPEIPGYRNAPNSLQAGMLREDQANVSFDAGQSRYILQTTNGSDIGQQVEAGWWLLPVLGSSPVKITRQIEDIGGAVKWELDGPPMTTDVNGNAVPLLGSVEFWYMPGQITAYDDNDQEIGTWRIRPIIAITKQVQL